jgi:hypothetical protein
MAESNYITNTVQSMTCIHGIHKTMDYYVFMCQFITVVERVTVVMYRAPILKKGLMTKSIIHNNIDGDNSVTNPQ